MFKYRFFNLVTPTILKLVRIFKDTYKFNCFVILPKLELFITDICPNLSAHIDKQHVGQLAASRLLQVS